MKWILLVLISMVLLTPGAYFVYCVEKKRQWALDMAESMNRHPSWPFM